MPIVAGIDEAGYGPLLGPLVVGLSAWRVPDAQLGRDFWTLLEPAVTRQPRSRDGRLPVADSKQVHAPRRGIAALERPVLAFAAATGLSCTRLDALLAGLGNGDLVDGNGGLNPPWYDQLDRTLPLAGAAARFEGAAKRLADAMQAAGIELTTLRARVVTEARFNQRVAATRNKAAVLIEAILTLLDGLAREARREPLFVRIDRLGGRHDYRGLLTQAFDGFELRELRVDDRHSRYRLARGRQRIEVEFAVDADRTHLPVSLASMVAKYVREALMQQFNAFWRRLAPCIRPTAGYTTDARRFLRQIEPLIARAGLDPLTFVRQR